MKRIRRVAYLWASWVVLILGTGSSWNRDLGPLVVPEQYAGGQDSTASPTSAWWVELKDDTLVELIALAHAENLDLRTIDSQLEMSTARSFQSLSPALPMVGVDISRQQQPCRETGFALCDIVAAQSGEEAPERYSQGSLTLAASLGVDLWGEHRKNWRSARLEVAALEGDQQSLALVVANQVAQSWLDMRHGASLLALLEEQRQSTQALLDETVRRFERTEASSLDVLQQRQQLAALDAQVPIIQGRIDQAHRQLSVLLGGKMDGNLNPQSGLPEFSDPPSIGQPSDLIERRPDVKAAWNRYEAGLRREQSAIRATLPDLSLSAQTGRTSINILEAESERNWALGATVSIPLMTGGAAASGLMAARAETDALHRAAQQSVLEAMGEVESALAMVQGVEGQRTALDTQVQTARLAHTQAVQLYESGLTPYLSVLSTMSALQQAEVSRLQAQRDYLSIRISLSTALGNVPGANP